MNANVYVARFVVSGGDAAPDIPPTAVDKGFEPRHCLEHTAALTRAIATSEVYTKVVLNSLQEICTTSHESPTLPASASGGLSPGVAAVIVISAVVGAVLVVALLLWRWNCLYQHVEYGSSSPSPVLEEEIALFAPPQEDSSMQQDMQEQQRCIAEATTDDDDSMNPYQNKCSFSPPLHTSNVLSKICYHRECIKLR